jgi:hypothetical protein
MPTSQGHGSPSPAPITLSFLPAGLALAVPLRFGASWAGGGACLRSDHAAERG